MRGNNLKNRKKKQARRGTLLVKQKIVALGLSSILLFSMTGCSKQKEIENELAADTTSNAVRLLNVPEKVEYEVMSTAGKKHMKVNALVDANVPGKVSAYSQVKNNFDEESVKEKAKQIFDDGAYSFVKPITCYTKKELQELTQSKEDSVLKTSAEIYLQDLGDSEEFESSPYEEGKFSKGITLESEDASLTCFYDEIMIMEGKIQGEDYRLMAYTNSGVAYFQLLRLPYVLYSAEYLECANIYTRSGNQPLWLRSRSGEEELNATFEKRCGKVKCNYTREEAAQMAQKFGENISGDTRCVTSAYATQDFDTCVVALEDDGVRHLLTDGSERFVPFDETEESGKDDHERYNGYSFMLQKEYDGIPEYERDYWWNGYEMTTDADPDMKKQVVQQEVMHVCVDDQGVTSVTWLAEDYTVKDVLSKDVELMDFEEVQTLAKEYLVKQLDYNEDINEGGNDIASVQLRYITVKYDDQYALIPAWAYSFSGGDQTVMMINAMDGSLVYMYPFL